MIIGIAALSVAQTVGACEYHSFFMLFVFPSLLMEGNFEIQQRGIGHGGHPSSWQYTQYRRLLAKRMVFLIQPLFKRILLTYTGLDGGVCW